MGYIMAFFAGHTDESRGEHSEHEGLDEADKDVKQQHEDAEKDADH